MLLLLTTTALALAPEWDRYPQTSTVVVPDEGRGAYGIDIPPQLRSLADPLSGSDMVLVDESGEIVPTAWARGAATPVREYVRVLPTRDTNVFMVEGIARPVDMLQVDLDSPSSAATVTVEVQRGDRWERVGGPTTVWRYDGDRSNEVDLVPTAEPLRVTVQHHLRPSTAEPRISAWLHPAPHVPPSRITLPVSDWRITESGLARYTVDLPQPLPVRRLVLHPEGDVLDRRVGLMERELESWETPSLDQRIRRVLIGQATVDETTIAVTTPPTGDELVFWIDTDGKEPLIIPEVTLELEGARAYALDPGPGPLQLLSGAPADTTRRADLQVAVPELVRLEVSRLAPQPPQPNPAYQPPEVRAHLAEPGPVLDLDDQRWVHDVPATGLVRVELGRQILANARPDLGDLRLVDDSDHAIPYLLRRRPLDHDWGELQLQRSEEGRESHLRVTLPERGVPVSTLSLHTAAPLFQRRVTVWKARGADLQPLRTTTWVGSERPTTLTLDIDANVDGQLLVTIDNGDNPPLPIDHISATWPAWELVAVLPDAPTRLVYGDARAERPSYDLALVGEELTRRAADRVQPGEARALTPPQPTLWDRGVLYGGLGVLVLGLGGLTLSLLGSVPEERRAPASDGKTDGPQEPDQPPEAARSSDGSPGASAPG